MQIIIQDRLFTTIKYNVLQISHYLHGCGDEIKIKLQFQKFLLSK